MLSMLKTGETLLSLSFSVRLHNSSMQSQADTRRDLNSLMGKFAKMQEDIDEVRSFSEAAAGKVKAAEMQDVDIEALGVKWETVEQIQAAAEEPTKKLAILHLLNSGLISRDPTHVVSSALNFFIAPDLLRRLCIKMLPGYVYYQKPYFYLPFNLSVFSLREESSLLS